ncbi:MAG: aminotransferase class IV [bacterium]
MSKVFINGEFFTEENARISVFDHGFLYGDGIFETLRSYSGRIFRIMDHLDRLFESARRICLSMPWDRPTLTKILNRCLAANECKDAVLRLSVSRGVGPPGLDPDLCLKPTITVLTRPFNGYPEEMYKDGIRITLVHVKKILPEAIDPNIKSTNFLNHILAKIEAKRAGADEGILLNHDGFLTEGTVSNIFFVKERILFTPALSSGILDGISRKVALEIAMEKDIPVKQGLFLPEDLETADEVFLTNTTYEIMPAGWIERKKLNIGPITRQIRAAFQERVRR